LILLPIGIVWALIAGLRHRRIGPPLLVALVVLPLLLSLGLGLVVLGVFGIPVALDQLKQRNKHNRRDRRERERLREFPDWPEWLLKLMGVQERSWFESDLAAQSDPEWEVITEHYRQKLARGSYWRAPAWTKRGPQAASKTRHPLRSQRDCRSKPILGAANFCRVTHVKAPRRLPI
jgi:hypothetical protein